MKFKSIRKHSVEPYVKQDVKQDVSFIASCRKPIKFNLVSKAVLVKGI